MIARAGLLALLPVIALAVYLEGQKYDPDTLDFSKAQETPSARLLPEAAGGFAREGNVRSFTRDNLFEYVNGHAEFFISSGFESLAVGEYGNSKDSAGPPSFTVDVYDMGSPSNSFGVMTNESGGARPVDIGFMGYAMGEAVVFMKGRYYVKIASFSKDADIAAFAKAVDRGMGDIPSKIVQFDRFPGEGAMDKGRGFIRRDYMGLDFFSNVFEQKYERNGKEFTAFLVTPEGGPEAFMEKAMKFYDDMGVKVDTFTAGDYPAWEVHDEYEGTWAMVRSGDGFLGVRELDDKSERVSFLNEMASRRGEE